MVYPPPRAAEMESSAVRKHNITNRLPPLSRSLGSSGSPGGSTSETSLALQCDPSLVAELPEEAIGQLNAFTVDVEDYFQVSGFEKQIDRSTWDRYESRVRASNQRILDLLRKHNVRATFYVLGWVAKHHPEVVRDIVSEGHEIGTHSYWHQLVYQLTPNEFRSDLRDSIKLLEDLTGGAIRSYRAPSFSITAKSLWALEILAEEGIELDSSIFPIRHDRYGIPHAPHEVHHLETASGRLTEFPSTVVRWGMNLPVSGGGYFRLYPVELTIRALQHVNQKERRPFIFYIHPWELDPGQPRLKAGSFLGRCRHYVNLHATELKLDRLLARFRFGTVTESMATVEARSYQVGQHPYSHLQLAVT